MRDRIASLDFLRGCAAFAVAIAHFFMARGIATEKAETASILGVEIFFVPSGYVLAPQIPDIAFGGVPWPLVLLAYVVVTMATASLMAAAIEIPLLAARALPSKPTRKGLYADRLRTLGCIACIFTTAPAKAAHLRNIESFIIWGNQRLSSNCRAFRWPAPSLL